MKLAIASGKTYFTSIGDPAKSSYYIITGKPVWEVKFAEGLCRYGYRITIVIKYYSGKKYIVNRLHLVVEISSCLRVVGNGSIQTNTSTKCCPMEYIHRSFLCQFYGIARNLAVTITVNGSKIAIKFSRTVVLS